MRAKEMCRKRRNIVGEKLFLAAFKLAGGNLRAPAPARQPLEKQNNHMASCLCWLRPSASTCRREGMSMRESVESSIGVCRLPNHAPAAPDDESLAWRPVRHRCSGAVRRRPGHA